jgi:hypothetical protein
MSIAIGDLNGDGFPDLVTANYGGASVSVLFGDGSGAFGSGRHVGPPIPNDTTYATGSSPTSVAIGDLNGDGHPDLVTANLGDNTVSVFLGNGAGGFAARKDFATATGPYSLGLIDANGDGHLDVAVADQPPIFGTPNSPVSVLLGDGAGELGPKTDVPVPMDPYSLAVGDMDGDGQPDLVVAGQNGLSVLPTLKKSLTTLAVSPGTAIQTRALTLTATVVATSGHLGHWHSPWTPTGSVQFFDGFTLLGSAPVDVHGTASLTLPAPFSGTRTLSADYRGDGKFFGSGSAPMTKTVLPASVLGVPQAAPVAFALEAAAPNPTRGAFSTRFALPGSAPARLEVMDVAGRRVAVHDVGALGAGSHTIMFGAERRLPPGLYLVRLTQGQHVGTTRVVVLE